MDFYIVRHQYIYESIATIAESGGWQEIDYLTIIESLRMRGKLEDVGGVSYITELTTLTPSSLNAVGYARAVQETSYRRRLIEIGGRFAALAHTQSKSLRDIHAELEREINTIAAHQIRTFSSSKVLFSNFTDRLLANIREAEGGRPRIGCKTGIPEWDEVFAGAFAPGMYTVLSGPTGVGKTWAMIQMAAAAMYQVPVYYFTLENLEESISDRMVACESGVPFSFVRSGSQNGKALSSENARLALEASARLERGCIEVISHLSSAAAIRDHLISGNIRHGRPGIAFVDTLNQLADAATSKDSRYENLTRASGLLTRIVRETKCGVVAGVQQRLELSVGMRADAAKGAAYPSKHTIESARTIVQHADLVIGIYSPEYVARETNNSDYYDPECERDMVLFVNVKSRESTPGGGCKVRWNQKIPRFETKGMAEKVDLNHDELYRQSTLGDSY
jgi:replicative DNA helicase